MDRGGPQLILFRKTKAQVRTDRTSIYATTMLCFYCSTLFQASLFFLAVFRGLAGASVPTGSAAFLAAAPFFNLELRFLELP
jgi:hypothetical protein